MLSVFREQLNGKAQGQACPVRCLNGSTAVMTRPGMPQARQPDGPSCYTSLLEQPGVKRNRLAASHP